MTDAHRRLCGLCGGVEPVEVGLLLRLVRQLRLLCHRHIQMSCLRNRRCKSELKMCFVIIIINTLTAEGFQQVPHHVRQETSLNFIASPDSFAT